MAEARQQSEWDRTAALIAKLHNVNCANRADMIRDPQTCNPYRARRRRKEQPAAMIEVSELASLYLG